MRGLVVSVFVSVLGFAPFALAKPADWKPNVRGVDNATLRQWDTGKMPADLRTARQREIKTVPSRMIVYATQGNEIALLFHANTLSSYSAYWVRLDDLDKSLRNRYKTLLLHPLPGLARGLPVLLNRRKGRGGDNGRWNTGLITVTLAGD